MYYKLKEGLLKKLTSKAINKSGNIRNLERDISIPRSTLGEYHLEKRAISKNNLSKLEIFLGKKVSKKEILKEMPDNWKQKKGGINSVKTKRKLGTFKEQLNRARKKAENKSSEWHKKMKKENPEKYYTSQYEKFKKIGEYKFTTLNGEKVRNNLEKETADKLKKLKIAYRYEPYINIQNKAFFPDFILKDKIIIECTAWRGYDKAIKLKKKIKYLEKKYKVYVLIPKALNKYYKILNNHLIFDLNEKDLIAQLVEHMAVTYENK